MNEKEVAALQEERRGYVMRNLPDRVAAVDEVLASFGVHVDDEGHVEQDEHVDQDTHDVELAVEDGGKSNRRKK